MRSILTLSALTITLGLAAFAYANWDETHVEGYGTPFCSDKAIAALPAAESQKFQETMKEAHDENKTIYLQIRQLHKELYTILTARTFDQDEFLDKSKKIRDLQMQAEANLNESFTAAAAALTQAERKSLAHLARSYND